MFCLRFDLRGSIMDQPDEEGARGRLVSTRVPTDLARAVELAAARELISVASYARRALLQAVRAKVADHG
jgi:predicted HicB family RNase H-like nuclease